MHIALVQQHAGPDPEENLARGLAAFAEAAGRGADLVAYAELAFSTFHPQRPAEGQVPDRVGKTRSRPHKLY